MSPDEVAGFLGNGHTLIVTTLGRDGYAHSAPMWYTMRDGLVAFRSFTKSQKIVNLKRDPRVTLLLEEGHAYGELKGVIIKGEAELIEDPVVVLELYGAMSARYAFVGETPVPLSGDQLEAAFGRFAAKNTAVIVNPVSVISWDHTKLGGSY